MAGIIAHLYLANNLWSQESQRLFPKRSTGERKKLLKFFLAGNVAPDIGQFPGGDVFISSLSHYVRTSTLAENLFRLAKTDEEKAFAYGWVGHIYTDVLVHLFINRKVAETVHQFDADAYDLFKFNPKLEHMRLEFGYDLDLLREYAELKPLRVVFPSWIPSHNNSLLQRAYLATYGYVITEKLMIKSRKSIEQSVVQLIKYYTFLNMLKKTGLIYKILNTITKLVFFLPMYSIFSLLKKPAIMAILTPKPHGAADFVEFEHLLQQVQMTYRVGLSHNFSDLKDYNLDTGKVLEYGTNKHADATLKKWGSFIQNLHLDKLSKKIWKKSSRTKLKKYLRSVYKKRVTKRKIKLYFKHN